jgi:hypothetical protein
MVEMIAPVGPVTVVVSEPSELWVFVIVTFAVAVDITVPFGPLTVVVTDPSVLVMVVTLFLPLPLEMAPTASLGAAPEIGVTASSEEPLMAKSLAFAYQL